MIVIVAGGEEACELMKGNGKRIFLAVFIVSAFAVFVYCAFVTGKRQTARLPNGTELSFVAMTHGPSNVCFPGGVLDRLIYALAPVKGISIGSFKIVPVTPLVDYWSNTGGRVALQNRAVVWIRHWGGTHAPPFFVAQANTFSDVRATMADEVGEEWEMRPNTLDLRSLSQNVVHCISLWHFSAFPRRGKILKFRIYGRNNSDGWDTLAEFRIPNPTPSRYTVWKSSPLPVTQAKGDMEVSLVELISGTKTIHWMPKDKRPFTMARFAVKQKGKPTEAWLPDRMEAADATGNEAEFPIIDYGITNGLACYDAQGISLSPSEVWRIRMRFAREKDLAPEQVWTSPELPVRGGNLVLTNLTTNFQSYQITLACARRNTIRLKLNPTPKAARMRLVGIVDNGGKRIEHTSGGFGDDEFEAQWNISPEAEFVTVTIGLAETRQFEFLAQPVRQ